MIKKLHTVTLFFVLTLFAAFAAACSTATPAVPAPVVPTSVPIAPTVARLATQTRVPASPTAAVPTSAPTVARLATQARVPASPTAAVPTSAPVAPTSAPIPTKPATSSGQSTATGYDGQWEGTTSSDTSVSFGVSGNQITSVNLSYSVQVGGCSVSGSYSTTPDNTLINGNTFTIQLTDSDGKQFTFTGTFASDTQASGTLQVKGPTESCGAIDAKATWKATLAAADSNSTSSATPDVSTAPATVSIADTDVLLAFFQAVNAKNLDAALALVDDQVVFNIASTPGIGKADLEAYLQKQTSRSITYAASNLASNGGVVSFTLKTSDKTTAVDDDTATVDENKIQTLVLH